jgi:hypothetical protein
MQVVVPFVFSTWGEQDRQSVDIGTRSPRKSVRLIVALPWPHSSAPAGPQVVAANLASHNHWTFLWIHTKQLFGLRSATITPNGGLAVL